MDPETENLVNSNEHLEFDETLNKVVCKLTKHEMPLNSTIIEKYIKGKKFDKARAEFLYSQYSNYLTKTLSNQLFCELTSRFISFTYKDIYNHINGYNFLRAAELWLKCKEENKEFKPITTIKKKDELKFKKMLKELDEANGEEGQHDSNSDHSDVDVDEEMEEEASNDEDDAKSQEEDEVMENDSDEVKENQKEDSNVDGPPSKKKRTSMK